MATIKSRLDELDRERADAAYAAQVKQQQAALAQQEAAALQAAQPVVPLEQSPAYQAAYDAARMKIDQAVAAGPLFSGTGAVGEKAQQRAMEQGLYPQPGVQSPVQAPVPDNTVGAKVRERAIEEGPFSQRTGQVGEGAALRAQAQGLYPDVAPSQESPAPSTWYDGLFGGLNDRIAQTQGEMEDVQALNEEMLRREESRKRIAALGDAFASFANLVGTAHGAENQRQTYASPLVSESIDRSRQLRAGRMQQIRKNLDEQRDALLLYQMNNDPDYLPNRMKQQQIDVQRGNQQLQYDKLAQQAANQGATQQLNRDKFEYQQQKDAKKYDLDVRKQDSLERNRADLSAARWARIGQANQRLAQGGGGSGSSGGSGGWSRNAKANFNAFKTEVAQKAGYDTWEEFAGSTEVMNNRDLRTFVDNVNGAASSTGKQEGILNNYAEQYAPEFWKKYYLQGTKQTSSPRSEKPRLYDKPKGTLQGF